MALEERKYTDQKFVQMDKFIHNRLQRQDNIIWEVENVKHKFEKEHQVTEAEANCVGCQYPEVFYIAQPLASDNVYRAGKPIPGNSQRGPPIVVSARRGPALRAPATRANDQQFRNWQDRDRHESGFTCRTGPGPGYSGVHFDEDEWKI